MEEGVQSWRASLNEIHLPSSPSSPLFLVHPPHAHWCAWACLDACVHAWVSLFTASLLVLQVVDAGQFFELQPEFGKNMLVGFAVCCMCPTHMLYMTELTYLCPILHCSWDEG